MHKTFGSRRKAFGTRLTAQGKKSVGQIKKRKFEKANNESSSGGL
jgi:hypothetical protein